MVAYRTPSQHATARLFCLPHAGGTAQTFLRWRKYVPAWIDLCAIELPGRARRIDEPQPRDVDAVVAEFLDNSRDLLDLPYAVFGHSLGGLLAYQITRTVEETGRPAPVRPYVSATRPPADEATAPRRHQLGDRNRHRRAGFAVDEPLLELGRSLKLPPWLEPTREQIAQALPTFTLPDLTQPDPSPAYQS